MTGSETDEWFLPDPEGITPIGPLTFEDILEQIKSGKLTYDCYVSCPQKRGEKWLRIFEFDEFETIMVSRPICPPPKLFRKGIYKEKTVIKKIDLEEINQKAAEGVLIECPIIIHDNQIPIKGTAHRISLNSVYVLLSKDYHVKICDEFIITLFSKKHSLSFSATAVVIELKEELHQHYVNFYLNKVNPQDKRKIIKYINDYVQKEN